MLQHTDKADHGDGQVLSSNSFRELIQSLIDFRTLDEPDVRGMKPDMRLTVRELQNKVEEAANITITLDEARSLLQILDKDGDGVISLFDFVRGRDREVSNNSELWCSIPLMIGRGKQQRRQAGGRTGLGGLITILSGWGSHGMYASILLECVL